MYNSTSKQFVAAAVMRLAEQGRLSIDDPVSRHLPGWRHLPQSLRIRHLLTHMSGLRDAHVQPALGALFERPGTSWDEMMAAARETPSDAPPGERWSYGNINFMMLQAIVERVTGGPLIDALDEMFFLPLGLAVRVCEPQPGAARGSARGHVPRDGALAGHDPEPVHLFVGAGGLCGSALDLARWTRALATGRVVSPASYRLMTAPAPMARGEAAPYGFGLAVVRPDGVRRIGHGGYGGGMSAQAAYYPDSETTVVLMGNRFASPEWIERKVVRRLFALPDPPAPDRPLSPDERRRFAGSFDVGVHGWHPKVEERDGRLWFVLPGPPIAFPLAYRGDGLFADARDPDGWQLLFSAEARELRITGMGLMTWYGRRVAAPAS
jgi:CubicO group peptidase (beta-lactamase class C family)